MDKLSNGDPSKHKEIYKMNYTECLNIMAFWHFRDEYLKKVQRAIDRKNKK